MRKQNIVIGLPIRRMPHPRMDACLKAVKGTSRHNVATLELREESLISRARNTITAEFLRTNGDWLYFWDDDIETANIGGDAGNVVDMLVSHGLPLVGGLYSTRGMGGHCAGRVDNEIPCTGRLWQIKYLAGGSMMIRRDVIERMAEANPQLVYEARSNEGTKATTVPCLFQPYVYDREYLSEDFAFCQRWIDLGGEVWADNDVRLFHWGEAPFALIDPRKVVKT